MTPALLADPGGRFRMLTPQLMSMGQLVGAKKARARLQHADGDLNSSQTRVHGKSLRANPPKRSQSRKQQRGRDADYAAANKFLPSATAPMLRPQTQA